MNIAALPESYKALDKAVDALATDYLQNAFALRHQADYNLDADITKKRPPLY